MSCVKCLWIYRKNRNVCIFFNQSHILKLICQAYRITGTVKVGSGEQSFNLHRSTIEAYIIGRMKFGPVQCSEGTHWIWKHLHRGLTVFTVEINTLYVDTGQNWASNLYAIDITSAFLIMISLHARDSSLYNYFANYTIFN